MPTAIYPGTFDPITNGHIDIAVRASRIFTKVIAVVSDNPQKKCLFSADERYAMVYESLKNIKNVRVVQFGGLIIDCIEKYKATVIIRGLRALSDFDYEFQMAFTNRKLNSKADTVFLMPSARYTYLSSTMIRQIAQLGGEVKEFLPDCARKKLKEKCSGKY
jgi:pantetheine-phosphate adenylyltransferase